MHDIDEAGAAAPRAPDPLAARPRLARLAPAAATALTLAGCLLAWLVFWDFGALALVSHDWPKEALYYDVIRDALRSGQVPFYIDKDAQGTPWFLAIPEISASPQAALLLALGNGAFAMANGLVLWLVGIAGCFLYRRAYAIGTVPFLFVVALFSLNGHIVAHLAVGHSMWAGYFLSPFVVLHTSRFVDGDGSSRRAVLLGMSLAAMLFQGAFHLAIYFALLLGILGLLMPRRLGFVIGALLIGGLLGAARILPALLAFADIERGFMSGYPGPSTLLDALVGIRAPDTPPLAGFTAEPLGWWEYDAFVGPFGLAFILAFGSGWLRARGEPTRILAIACLILVALGFGDVFFLLGLIGAPVLGQERVASRVLVVPLVFFIFLAGRGYARHKARTGAPPIASPVALLWLALTFGGLVSHLLVWRIALLEAAPWGVWQLQPLAVVRSPPYERLSLAAFAVSAVAWAAAAAYLLRYRGRPSAPPRATSCWSPTPSAGSASPLGHGSLKGGGPII